jgi:predicted nucleic acid-binding protein
VRNWSANRRQALERFIHSRFNVEYPDDRLCRLYGELVADARKRGLSLPLTDTWQAATALALGTPLVTHNANNYRGVVNLQLITETA